MANEEFDVFIIGGGVTGTGAALDAAARGLKVGLVEQRDYASGTSSRSSKLFHGGIRYLEQFNFGLVREALAERNLMLEVLCPHLTTPVSFVYPLKYPVWERFYVGAGVMIYDFLGKLADSSLPKRDHFSRDELAEIAPALATEKLHGAVRYWDVVVDDARHTMTIARTAAAHGAALATSARVTGLDLDERSKLVHVTDLEDGRHIEVKARAVINATGVWTDDIVAMGGATGLRVTASKGIHLVVPRSRIQADTGMLLRTKVSVLFVIPFDDFWIIGTTDTPWDLRRAHPAASRTDIEYLLEWANTVLDRPLTTDDVVGVYAGLRPLLSGESDETSKLSREHAVADNGKGLITIAGGKYTTYRVMAEDVVDAAGSYLDHPPPASPTAGIPLVGGEGFSALSNEPGPGDIPEDDYRRLLGRYGTRVSDLIDLIRDEPSLGERLVPDSPHLGAEILYAATHEGASHLDDVLTRRTRISIETRHRGTQAVKQVSDLMRGPLDWDAEAVDREIEHYRARVDAERDSHRQFDDRTADAARMGAPDVRTGTAE